MKRLPQILSILMTALLLGAVSSCEPEVTPEPTVLDVPTGLTLHDATLTSLTFQWSPVSGALSYDWKLMQGSTQVQTGSANGRNVTVSSLQPGTEYQFSVRAFSLESTSGWSSALTARTQEPEPPQPPGPQPGESEIKYEEYKIPAAEEDGVARAFPGAEGGGMYTTGGRGGAVYHVTNLNDSGEGSFRWAVTRKGARTVVFDVAGIIELQSAVKISEGNLTIAGQTAPGGGICLKNYTVNLQADNIIVRYLHFRLGDEGPNAGDSEDCIWGRYLNNIVLDHCSMSWSIDECASFYANRNFTMQWCILTESMNNSAHSKGAHGYGGIWGGRDASFHHNLLANHYSRNPRPDHPEIYPKNSDGSFDLSKRGHVDFRNLVVYNWGDNHTYGGEGGQFNLVNCYYKPGPDSKDRYYFFDAYSVYSSSKVNYGYPALYMAGNIHTGHDDISENNTVHGVYFHEAGSYSIPADYAFQTAPWALEGPSGQAVYTTTHTAEAAFKAVLDYAGDRLHHDSVDKRTVDGARSNTGKIIDTPASAGGWPTYTATAAELAKTTDTDGDGIPDWFEDKAGLDKQSAADGAAVTLDAAGRYTNLEMYLQYLVRDITAAGNAGGNYLKIQ